MKKQLYIVEATNHRPKFTKTIYFYFESERKAKKFIEKKRQK